jgi:hypothetical protein
MLIKYKGYFAEGENSNLIVLIALWIFRSHILFSGILLFFVFLFTNGFLPSLFFDHYLVSGILFIFLIYLFIFCNFFVTDRTTGN